MCNSVSGGPCIDDSPGAGSGELIDLKDALKESIIKKLDLYRVVLSVKKKKKIINHLGV